MGRLLARGCSPGGLASAWAYVDEDITSMDTNNTPQADIQGSITRACARQLNLQVISFLRNYSCAFESSMLSNDLIVLRNEGEDQQGHGERPWRHGGLARTSGSRGKPKPVRLRFSFGLQKQPVLKRTHMSHTESDLDVLYMDRKIISRSFQWNWFQAQIHLESTGIVCTIWHPESVPVLRHYFGPMGRVSSWSPLGTHPRVCPWP
jgi:hypothetical protein